MCNIGIYEQLINKLVTKKIEALDTNKFYYKKSDIEKSEASTILSQYLAKIISFALNQISGEDSIEKQIKLTNEIILLLKKDFNVCSISF